MQLETASGEGSNRLTGRIVVRMLRELHRTLLDHALAPGDLLPVPGCDNAPVGRMFPSLAQPPNARALAVKTGTLRITDGGVAALAGFFNSRENGLLLFAVAAPKAGRRLNQWRSVEQAWVLDLLEQAGGVIPDDCGPEISSPDALASIEALLPQGSVVATASAPHEQGPVVARHGR